RRHQQSRAGRLYVIGARDPGRYRRQRAENHPANSLAQKGDGGKTRGPADRLLVEERPDPDLRDKPQTEDRHAAPATWRRALRQGNSDSRIVYRGAEKRARLRVQAS